MVVVVDKIVTSSSSLFLLFNQTPAPVNKVLYYSPNNYLTSFSISISTSNRRRKSKNCLTWALAGDHHNSSSSIGGDAAAASKKKKAVASHSNYMVAFDSSSCITRPLAEILRDLNKRIPDNIIINNNKQFTTTTTTTTLENDDQLDAAADQDDLSSKTYIPWYHANRMLSFYAPGWCGEIRDVIFSDNGSVTVVYRVTIRGSDGEAHRESTGTVSPPMDGHVVDAVAAAEEIAFCRACARFGLGLYLYHDE